MHNFTDSELKIFVDGIVACNDDALMREIFNQMVNDSPKLFVKLYAIHLEIVAWPNTPTIDSVRAVFPCLSISDYDTIKKAARSSGKVEAIKALRSVHRMGLLEAKQIVEAWFF